MTEQEILLAVSEQCKRNRRHGRTLQYDQQKNSAGQLHKLAVAILTLDRSMDPMHFPEVTWLRFEREAYDASLVRVISLLVQEIERVTQEL